MGNKSRKEEELYPVLVEKFFEKQRELYGFIEKCNETQNKNKNKKIENFSYDISDYGSDRKSTDNYSKCIICLDADARYLNIPRGYITYYLSCIKKFTNNSEEFCPLCRTKIEKMNIAYY